MRLLLAANDGHRKVRAAVVTVLGRLPKTDAVRAALAAKAAENEPRVRDAARRALAVASPSPCHGEGAGGEVINANAP